MFAYRIWNQHILVKNDARGAFTILSQDAVKSYPKDQIIMGDRKGYAPDVFGTQ